MVIAQAICSIGRALYGFHHASEPRWSPVPTIEGPNRRPNMAHANQWYIAVCHNATRAVQASPHRFQQAPRHHLNWFRGVELHVSTYPCSSTCSPVVKLQSCRAKPRSMGCLPRPGKRYSCQFCHLNSSFIPYLLFHLNSSLVPSALIFRSI